MNSSLPPVAQALLNTIAGTESAGSYNVIYGGQHFTDYGHHPNTPVRIASGPNAGNVSTAAGRYQFLTPTWNAEANRLGLPDFSPDNQDAAAWDLAQQTYTAATGRNLQSDLENGTHMSQIATALSPVWTSLPSGIEQGQSQSRFATTFNNSLSNVEGHPVPPNGIPAAPNSSGGPDDRALPPLPRARPLPPNSSGSPDDRTNGNQHWPANFTPVPLAPPPGMRASGQASIGLAPPAVATGAASISPPPGLTVTGGASMGLAPPATASGALSMPRPGGSVGVPMQLLGPDQAAQQVASNIANETPAPGPNTPYSVSYGTPPRQTDWIKGQIVNRMSYPGGDILQPVANGLGGLANWLAPKNSALTLPGIQDVAPLSPSTNQTIAGQDVTPRGPITATGNAAGGVSGGGAASGHASASPLPSGAISGTVQLPPGVRPNVPSTSTSSNTDSWARLIASLGSGGDSASGASAPGTAAVAPQKQTKTVYQQQTNPDYTKWLQSAPAPARALTVSGGATGAVGVNGIGGGSLSMAPQRGPAPPQYISTPKTVVTYVTPPPAVVAAPAPPPAANLYGNNNAYASAGWSNASAARNQSPGGSLTGSQW